MRRRFISTFGLGLAPLLPACAPMQAASPEAARHRALLREGHRQVDVIVEGRGQPLVLLPSSQRDSEDFDALAARFASMGYQVLRPQPRGMGQSIGPMQGLDLAVLASDVALAIERLARTRAIVIGHAFGHWVARVTDMNHPQWVRGVVVLGGAARQFPPGIAQSLAIASDLQQPQMRRLEALRAGFFAPGNDPSSWLQGWHPELREAYRTAGQTPPKDLWFPRSNSPILDLMGRDDPWRPAHTRMELAQVLGPKVTVQIIDGASHAMVPEQPAAIVAAVHAWIKALPA